MEFRISKELLLRGVRRTLGIVDKRTTMPILNHLLINAGRDDITICATDLEITLVAKYSAEVAEEGKFTIPAKKLYEFTRVAPDGMLTVKGEKEGMISLSSSRVVCRINTLSAEDYPEVGEDLSEPKNRINSPGLIEMIEKVAFAISQDEARPAITGALLEREGEVLRMVGTDGYRLSMYELPMDNEVSIERSVIIPRKGLLEIKRLIEEGLQGEYLIGVEKNNFILKGKDIFLKVNLIEGDFPDYRRVIRRGEGERIVCNREELIQGLNRVNVISSEGYGGVIFHIEEGMAVMTADDAKFGDVRVELDVEYRGESFTVGYTIDYLLDVLNVIKEERVVLEIGREMKPTFIWGLDDTKYLGVVMPLKM